MTDFSPTDWQTNVKEARKYICGSKKATEQLEKVLDKSKGNITFFKELRDGRRKIRRREMLGGYYERDNGSELPKLDHREIEQEIHRMNSRVEELAYAIEKMNPNESARAHLRAFWEMGK